MKAGPPPRLWIIDPSIHNPEDEGVRFILEDWPGEARVFRPALVPGDGPRPGDGHDADGFVLLGSAASVHDPLTWMEPLSAWLGPLIEGKIRKPLLGVCFGHQFITHLSGGAVGMLNETGKKRLGVEWTLLEHGRLLPGRRKLRVVVSHREEVQRVPAGYRIVAGRPGVAVDGLEHDELPVYSFQFHPEAREDFARRVGLPPTDLDDRVLADSRLLLGAFRRKVLDG
jgi:GMP synthase-like glutamine amidotransferase